MSSRKSADFGCAPLAAGAIIAIVGGLVVSIIAGEGRFSPALTPTSVAVFLPTPTAPPTPTPFASLASLVLKSEVQPDGTVKNSSTLSINSLGIGDLLLTYPQQINLNDSGLVRLSITPRGTLTNLSSVAVPTQNAALPPPLHFTDRIDIYPVMQAELFGAGFDVTANEQSLKAMLSDRPTEWTWTLKPKQEGSQLIVVRVFIPVRVDGIEQTLFTTLKNIPAEIRVTKSLKNQIEESLPIAIPALAVLMAAIIGAYATIQAKEREKKISELEKRITGDTAEKEKLEREIARLKSIRNWQFWHR